MAVFSTSRLVELHQQHDTAIAGNRSVRLCQGYGQTEAKKLKLLIKQELCRRQGAGDANAWKYAQKRNWSDVEQKAVALAE